MTSGIRLAALLAAPALLLAVAGGAEAGNRKAFKSLTAEAERWCEEIRKTEVYACSVEKCPCKEGLREVRRFDKLRTRAACVCTPDTGRAGVNRADADDFCVAWKRTHAKEDGCFVVAGHSCPKGTAELREFNRLRGHGPAHTACRGEEPKEEEEESGEGEKPADKPAAKQEAAGG